ncbi:MAG: heptosyltransferase [Blastocatellia bacterium]|jgi:predicted lipopolysaccharide heptosyltransferase III|nr:heptosyltransferase [Blastocatellia bacterium]
MNSLREIIESSPSARHLAFANKLEGDEPQALAPARWDWSDVRRVLVVRLRSIGDTVLTTPSLLALRRFLPHSQIDILLEDWVAPVLEGSDLVDRVIAIGRDSQTARARLARELRVSRYDVVYNLHGGTTATLLTRATGARHRVGFRHYQYARLHNHAAPSPLEIWQRPSLHSVEQQLALIGWTGVPVTDRPPTQLAVTDSSLLSISAKLRGAGFEDEEKSFAVIHPAAAFETKQWATEKFAQVAQALTDRGLIPIAIVSPKEKHLVESLRQQTSARVIALSDLSLPEVTALASRARLFVGNDSGIAHIAAAAGAPCVVIFGSSNVAHWRPWTMNANEIVREEMPCQPCHGYFCAEFEKPECILRVPVERVLGAIDRILNHERAT